MSFSWHQSCTQINMQETWTDFATPSLEVLGNLEVQMYISSPRHSAETASQSFALHFEKFLSFQRERKAKRFFIILKCLGLLPIRLQI